MTKKRWIERWVGVALSPELTSPMGLTDDGLVDFRGATFINEKCDRLQIEKADYSYANFDQAEFTECIFNDCQFSSAKLTRISTWNSVFKNCNFEKSDFRASIIGFNGTEFVNCNFSRVNVRRTNFLNAIFRDIVFDSKSFAHSYFDGSGFWNCRFQGDFRDIMFLGHYLIEKPNLAPPRHTGLHSIDFSKATLRSVGFRNQCVLADIKLPENNSAVICKAQTLLELLMHLSLDSQERELLSNYIYITQADPENQPLIIVSVYDLIADAGEQIATQLFTLIRSKITSTV